VKLNKTEIAIMTTIMGIYGAPRVSEIHAALPSGLFATRTALSARLCQMRNRGLLKSRTIDDGINEWIVSDEGELALRAAQQGADPGPIQPDSAHAPKPVISEPIQPDSVDILPDISADIPDPIAADFAAAIEAAEEVLAAELPEMDRSPRPPWLGCSDEAGPDEVSDELVEEANRLRLRRPLPREQDALYVLSVLIDTLGRDTPAMAYELTRIAAYIEGEYA